MSADFSNGNKSAGVFDASVNQQGSQYPENVINTPWGRLEPLITVDQLKSRFLKGIPLVLRIVDPETRKPFTITNAELKDYIELSVDETENETGLTLMPTQITQRLSYDRHDYESFGYMQLPHRPISSLQELSVSLADGSQVFVFPLQWIETANLIHGQLNIIPLAFSGVSGGTGIIGGVANGQGTAVFFNSLWNRPWVAALFGVRYVAGFKDGMMPKIVNQIIGINVAIRVLSQIAAAHSVINSSSIGLDGMSQSLSGPGGQRYALRIQELEAQKKLLVGRIRKSFGSKFAVGTI